MLQGKRRQSERWFRKMKKTFLLYSVDTLQVQSLLVNFVVISAQQSPMLFRIYNLIPKSNEICKFVVLQRWLLPFLGWMKSIFGFHFHNVISEGFSSCSLSKTSVVQSYPHAIASKILGCIWVPESIGALLP